MSVWANPLFWVSSSPSLTLSLLLPLPPSLPPSLCERSLGSEPSGVCFFEWIPDAADEAGWGRSCVSGVLRERERARERREEGGREVEREREKQPGREGAGGLVALHNTRWSSLCTQDLQVSLSSGKGGTSFHRRPRRGSVQPPRPESPERRAELELLTTQAPGEQHKGEIQEEEFLGNTSPAHSHTLTHTHTHTHTLRGRKNLWTCSASSGCGETGELFLVL